MQKIFQEYFKYIDMKRIPNTKGEFIKHLDAKVVRFVW
jgi:hypothetical protein